jgi:antirestriction protein
MEHLDPTKGGIPTPQNQIPYSQQPELNNAESHDERLIREGIEAAGAEEREIDDCTARSIAAQLHDGQRSALYALASTGAILEDDVYRELYADLESQMPQVQQWVEALRTYCLHRGSIGPVAGWAERHAEEEQERQRRSLLGSLAVGSEAPTAEQEQARIEQLEELTPDQETGSVDELGWFGLYRHESRPGGAILACDELGFRHLWETDSDQELHQRWTAIEQEYARFDEAVKATGHEPGEREADEEREDTPSGHHPEIWVGSLSDYNNGRLHGVWLDATLEPEELHEAVAVMLRNSHMPDAEEWAIMDYDDFCGLRLGEYAPLETVSRIANGIAEHGEAFAAWASHVGEDDIDALEHFEDHYHGHFDSTEAYVEDLLEETGSYRYFEDMPEDLRRYARFDVEQMARDYEVELFIVEASDGGVWMFDPRA